MIYGSKTLLNIALSSLTATQGLQIIGIKNTNTDNGYCNTGYAVSGGIDFNRDGFPDVLVGAPGQESGGGQYYDSGAAYIVFGSSTSSTSLYLKYLSSVFSYIAGSTPMTVAPPYDVNYDGYVDSLIGTFLFDKAYVVYGVSTGLTSIANLSTITSSVGYSIDGEANSWLGFSLAGIGDFNRDNIPDIIIGAPSYNSFQFFYLYDLYYYDLRIYSGSSAAYIIYGAKGTSRHSVHTENMTSSTGIKLIGEGSDLLGFSTKNLGAMYYKGLRKNAFIVGAPCSRKYTGDAYVIFAGVKGPIVNLTRSSQQDYVVKISGIYQWDYTGFAVSNAGDFNGDVSSTRFCPTSLSHSLTHNSRTPLVVL